jgi:hypothetical protein
MIIAREALEKTIESKKLLFNSTLEKIEAAIKIQISIGAFTLTCEVPYFIIWEIKQHLTNLGYEVKRNGLITLIISWEK